MNILIIILSILQIAAFNHAIEAAHNRTVSMPTFFDPSQTPPPVPPKPAIPKRLSIITDQQFLTQEANFAPQQFTAPNSAITPRTMKKPVITIEHSNWDSKPLQINLTSPNGSLKPAAEGKQDVSPNTTATKAAKILGIQGAASPSSKAARILGRSSAPTLFTNSDAALRMMDYISRNDFDNFKESYHLVNINEPVANFDGQTPFERAIDLDRIEMVRYMLGHGADLVRKNKFGQTAIDMAIEHNHIEPALFIIEKFNIEGVNQYTASGDTLLTAAINKGSKPLVELLLLKGASQNKAAQDGTTPLIAAAKSGHKEIAALLIQWIASLDARDQRGWTALMWAEKVGNSSIVDKLIKAGANQDIQALDTKTVIDQLYAHDAQLPADKRRSKREIEIEAIKWANVNYNDLKKLNQESSHGNSFKNFAHNLRRKISDTFFEPSTTPPGSAPGSARADSVKQDSDSRSKSNSKNVSQNASPGELSPVTPNPHRKSPVLKASKILGEDVSDKIPELPAQATELEYKDFIYALQTKDLTRAIDLIQNHGIKINEPIEAYHNRTPLEKAIDFDAPEIVAYMLDHGAHIYRKNLDNNNQTPLDLAVELGYNAIAQAMIEKMSDASRLLQNDRGETLVFRAAMYGNTGLLTYLLDKKLPVNQPDKKKRTPLMIAAMSGYKDIVKLLLDKGADVHARDKNDKTARMWAESSNKQNAAQKDLIEILRKAEAK